MKLGSLFLFCTIAASGLDLIAETTELEHPIAHFREQVIELPPFGPAVVLLPHGSYKTVYASGQWPPVQLDDWTVVEYYPPYGYIYQCREDSREYLLTEIATRPVIRRTYTSGGSEFDLHISLSGERDGEESAKGDPAPVENEQVEEAETNMANVVELQHHTHGLPSGIAIGGVILKEKPPVIITERIIKEPIVEEKVVIEPSPPEIIIAQPPPIVVEPAPVVDAPVTVVENITVANTNTEINVDKSETKVAIDASKNIVVDNSIDQDGAINVVQELTASEPIVSLSLLDRITRVPGIDLLDRFVQRPLEIVTARVPYSRAYRERPLSYQYTAGPLTRFGFTDALPGSQVLGGLTNNAVNLLQSSAGLVADATSLLTLPANILLDVANPEIMSGLFAGTVEGARAGFPTSIMEILKPLGLGLSCDGAAGNPLCFASDTWGALARGFAANGDIALLQVPNRPGNFVASVLQAVANLLIPQEPVAEMAGAERVRIVNRPVGGVLALPQNSIFGVFADEGLGSVLAILDSQKLVYQGEQLPSETVLKLTAKINNCIDLITASAAKYANIGRSDIVVAEYFTQPLLWLREKLNAHVLPPNTAIISTRNPHAEKYAKLDACITEMIETIVHLPELIYDHLAKLEQKHVKFLGAERETQQAADVIGTLGDPVGTAAIMVRGMTGQLFSLLPSQIEAMIRQRGDFLLPRFLGAPNAKIEADTD